MVKTKQIDPHFVQIVYEDLNYLSKEWNQDIDEPSLRRASPTLRRLLIEENGSLTYLAHAMNREFMIVVPTVSIPKLKGIAFFSVGGALTKTGAMSGMGLFFGDSAPSKAREGMIGPCSPMKLSKFLKQVCLVLSGVKINREEVIKYVANKIGGAHFDSSRDKTEALEKKYILMDQVHNGSIKSTAMGKRIIYYELLSTGQYVINSPDVQQFIKEIEMMIR